MTKAKQRTRYRKRIANKLYYYVLNKTRTKEDYYNCCYYEQEQKTVIIIINKAKEQSKIQETQGQEQLLSLNRKRMTKTKQYSYCYDKN